MEIMGANGCTFVFSICSAKCIYFALENQKQDKVMTSFSNYIFGQVEVVKWK